MSGIGRYAVRGVRYAPDDHDRFHRDLRVDYGETRRNALKSPGFVEAHADCEPCASIRSVGGER